MDQKDVLPKGMEAWNQINQILGDDDMCFESVEEFSVFYKNLCQRLFEIEGEIK